MIGQAFDYASETIADAFGMDEKQERVVRLVLIVGAAYFALKFVRSMVSNRD